jgi:histidinol dehydrogenase
MGQPFAGMLRIDLRPPATPGATQTWHARTGRGAGLAGPEDAAAREILQRVRSEGDTAVAEFTERFEGRRVEPGQFEVDADHWRGARDRIPPEVLEALTFAAENVRNFHRTQKLASSSVPLTTGTLMSRARPLRRVAVYAPGGTAAYPSSVLMAGIPAKVAGVREVILITPRASDVVLAAAELASIDRVFEIGGAQAIAAVAFGTASVPRVDKIVGPGNAYVTAAKRQVFGLVDIDSIAGPSEILVVADGTADAGVVAADLLSQAEHDRLACPILVTDDEALADAVDAALVDQLADLPRAEIATAALVDHGATVLVAGRAQMIQTANEYAPEHLELLVQRPGLLAEGIETAGAIFIGGWTPEAAGDYTAGPSHVLPTAGAARFGSPVGVWDFIKYTSVIELTEPMLRQQADAIVTLARAEGLEAHARAVLRRVAVDPTEPDPS